MPPQTNYIETLYPQIKFNISDPHSVLRQNKVTEKDIVNLCGGIPLANITKIKVDISSQYQPALCVQIKTDQYETVRTMDFTLKQIDNNIMIVSDEAKGKHIGTNLFLNQLVTARVHDFEKLHTIAVAPSKYDDEGTAWYGYYFWANLGFQNMEPDEYRAWAAEMQREEPTLSELMQTDQGRELWRNTGISWIGEFFLAQGHPCYHYLKLHLKRKGIQFDL